MTDDKEGDKPTRRSARTRGKVVNYAEPTTPKKRLKDLIPSRKPAKPTDPIVGGGALKRKTKQKQQHQVLHVPSNVPSGDRGEPGKVGNPTSTSTSKESLKSPPKKRTRQVKNLKSPRKTALKPKVVTKKPGKVSTGAHNVTGDVIGQFPIEVDTEDGVPGDNPYLNKTAEELGELLAGELWRQVLQQGPNEGNQWLFDMLIKLNKQALKEASVDEEGGIEDQMECAMGLEKKKTGRDSKKASGRQGKRQNDWMDLGEASVNDNQPSSSGQPLSKKNREAVEMHNQKMKMMAQPKERKRLASRVKNPPVSMPQSESTNAQNISHTSSRQQQSKPDPESPLPSNQSPLKNALDGASNTTIEGVDLLLLLARGSSGDVPSSTDLSTNSPSAQKGANGSGDSTSDNGGELMTIIEEMLQPSPSPSNTTPAEASETIGNVIGKTPGGQNQQAYMPAESQSDMSIASDIVPLERRDSFEMSSDGKKFAANSDPPSTTNAFNSSDFKSSGAPKNSAKYKNPISATTPTPFNGYRILDPSKVPTSEVAAAVISGPRTSSVSQMSSAASLALKQAPPLNVKSNPVAPKAPATTLSSVTAPTPTTKSLAPGASSSPPIHRSTIITMSPSSTNVPFTASNLHPVATPAMTPLASPEMYLAQNGPLVGPNAPSMVPKSLEEHSKFTANSFPASPEIPVVPAAPGTLAPIIHTAPTMYMAPGTHSTTQNVYRPIASSPLSHMSSKAPVSSAQRAPIVPDDQKYSPDTSKFNSNSSSDMTAPKIPSIPKGPVVRTVSAPRAPIAPIHQKSSHEAVPMASMSCEDQKPVLVDPKVENESIYGEKSSLPIPVAQNPKTLAQRTQSDLQKLRGHVDDMSVDQKPDVKPADSSISFWNTVPTTPEPEETVQKAYYLLNSSVYVKNNIVAEDLASLLFVLGYEFVGKNDVKLLPPCTNYTAQKMNNSRQVQIRFTFTNGNVKDRYDEFVHQDDYHGKIIEQNEKVFGEDKSFWLYVCPEENDKKTATDTLVFLFYSVSKTLPKDSFFFQGVIATTEQVLTFQSLLETAENKKTLLEAYSLLSKNGKRRVEQHAFSLNPKFNAHFWKGGLRVDGLTCTISPGCSLKKTLTNYYTSSLIYKVTDYNGFLVDCEKGVIPAGGTVEVLITRNPGNLTEGEITVEYDKVKEENSPTTSGATKQVKGTLNLKMTM